MENTIVDTNLGRAVPDLSISGFVAPVGQELWQLIQLWQNERFAPEVLSSEETLLGSILDKIKQQAHDINALRRDDNLSEEDHYMTMLVQTEMERVKFVLRSYIRTRLCKIERHAAFISQSPDNQQRLSQVELEHMQRYAEMLVSQFHTSVLAHLPESQQGLDDEMPTVPNMVSSPNFDRPVFVHARRACGPVILPDGSGFMIQEGSTHLMRYSTVQDSVLRGELELV